MGRWLLAALCGALCLGCSDEPLTAPTPSATVTFVYQSVIPPDVPFNPNALGCARSILPFTVHLLAGWLDFSTLEMSPAPDGRSSRAIATLPAPASHVVIMLDPAMCNVDPSSVGSVTERVFANGVLLTHVVRNANAAGMNGLAFSVSANGTVSP